MSRIVNVRRSSRPTRGGGHLYKQGMRFERQIMVDLERSQPGSVTLRSAGSHGPCDVLWASRAFDRPRAVQCKSVAGMTLPARLNLVAWCDRAGFLPVLATKEPSGWRYQRVLDDGSLVELFGPGCR